MEIDKIAESVRKAKKIRNAVAKLKLGDCDVENVTGNKVTFTVSFEDSPQRTRIVGFHP